MGPPGSRGGAAGPGIGAEKWVKASNPPLVSPLSHLELGEEPGRQQPAVLGEDTEPPPRSQHGSGTMRAAWLLLLALGLPCCPRCPMGGPRGLPPSNGHNETATGSRRPRAPDAGVLVAVGGWLGALLACVGRYVRRSRAETRLHLQYLRALPCQRPNPEEEEDEEEEELSTIL